jgi:hypothetical protein
MVFVNLNAVPEADGIKKDPGIGVHTAKFLNIVPFQ